SQQHVSGDAHERDLTSWAGGGGRALRAAVGPPAGAGTGGWTPRRGERVWALRQQGEERDGGGRTGEPLLAGRRAPRRRPGSDPSRRLGHEPRDALAQQLRLGGWREAREFARLLLDERDVLVEGLALGRRRARGIAAHLERCARHASSIAALIRFRRGGVA